MNSNTSDEDLMALYQEGSEEAFQILYRRHSGKIFGYLKKRCARETDVTDLFQEVFVKIHRSKHLYNKTLPVLPWIFSVTHSVLVDGIRKGERRNEVYDLNFDKMPGPAANAENPDLLPLLKNLPTSQQQALQMRYLEESTFEEIATRLKTSPMNVRQLISRGIKHLKGLAKEGDKS